MKRKVLHIVESFGSGVFSFLVDLVNKTDDEFEITIAYGRRKETLDNFKDYFSDSVNFIEVKAFTRSINPIKDLKALFEVKRIVKDINPDVIHLHSSKAGFIGRFAANGRKVRMLYNPHGFSFLMKNSSKVKRMLYWLIEKIGAFRKCMIVGCSEGEYKEALKLTENSVCINNGVDLEKLENDTKELKEKEIDFDNLKICTLGRIGYQKNPKLFNEIASELKDIQFTWIGEGDLKEELISNNIVVTGWKQRDDVLKILNDNDIFILTSLWEGLPISLLESMFMKKICIVSDCIGNRDVIRHGQNGFIAKNKDEYVQIIKDIAKNKYDLKRIKENQISDLKQEYNIIVMSKKYMEKYEG